MKKSYNIRIGDWVSVNHKGIDKEGIVVGIDGEDSGLTRVAFNGDRNNTETFGTSSLTMICRKGDL